MYVFLHVAICAYVSVPISILAGYLEDFLLHVNMHKCLFVDWLVD